MIGLLAIANLIKFGYLSADILVKNKDFIDVIGKIFTAIVVLVGAAVSYLRFFRGRLFSYSANIQMNVSLHKINDDIFLHVINVDIKNDGTFPIWEPMPILIVYPHGISALGDPVEVKFWEPELEKSNLKVVNALETEQFYAFYYAPKSIAVFTYVVRVKSRDGVEWSRKITITNRTQDTTKTG
jgi:hypothetical protein